MLKNTSENDIVLNWGQYAYAIKAGETKEFSPLITRQLLKRHKKDLQIINIEEEIIKPKPKAKPKKATAKKVVTEKKGVKYE